MYSETVAGHRAGAEKLVEAVVVLKDKSTRIRKKTVLLVPQLNARTFVKTHRLQSPLLLLIFCSEILCFAKIFKGDFTL